MRAGRDSEQLTRRGFLSVCGAGAVALSGCVTRGEPTDLVGEIIVDGSNTVLPHSAAVAEEFQWRNNRVEVPVRGSGTGAGFQKFCAGESDLQNASRVIHETERDRCGANDVGFLELEVVLDGIAIIANPDNEFCECLTVDELQRIWESGSDVETWNDVRDEWPDEEIQLFGRDSASGTFDYFTEAINGQTGNIRSDYSASSDTNVIVRGVRGSEYALGFGGAGYYYENDDALKLVSVDDGDGCVDPERETIETREYSPLSRSMYTYLRQDLLTNETYREFARFYFRDIDDEVQQRAVENDIAEPDERLTWTQWAARKVGFYAIPDETVENDRRKLEAAIEEVLA